jgi:hypothetical protein
MARHRLRRCGGSMAKLSAEMRECLASKTGEPAYTHETRAVLAPKLGIVPASCFCATPQDQRYLEPGLVACSGSAWAPR